VADEYGRVVDGKGTFIGRVVKSVLGEIVKTATGAILGWTNPGGFVVNEGKVVGKADESGRVVDGKGTFIGTVVKTVFKTADGVVKTVLKTADGVVKTAGGVVGSLGGVEKTGQHGGGGGPLEVVKNSAGRVIGTIKKGGVVVNEKGHAIGKVADESGRVVDGKGTLIGRVVKSVLGEIVKTATGAILGWTNPGGFVVNEGKVVGKADESGRVIDGKGTFIGTVVKTVVKTADGVVKTAGGVVGALGEAGKGL